MLMNYRYRYSKHADNRRHRKMVCRRTYTTTTLVDTMQPLTPSPHLPLRLAVGLLMSPIFPQVALNGFCLSLTNVVVPNTMGETLPDFAALATGLLLGFTTLMNSLSPLFGALIDHRNGRAAA